jgi:hypothetical protein
MSDPKETNPKAAIGIRKVAFSVLPWNVIGKLAVAMLEGALKYGRHNYRVSGARASTYFDAAVGHLFDWWEGEDIDPASGLPHPIKAMASLTVLMDCVDRGNWTDDRPPRSYQRIRSGDTELNRLACKLLDQYPSPAAAKTERQQPQAVNVLVSPPNPNWGTENSTGKSGDEFDTKVQVGTDPRLK